MTAIGPETFARVVLLGFAAGVGALYGLSLAFLVDEYRSRFAFKDFVTRRDRARVYASYARAEFDPEPRETAKYTLAWGAAGASLFGIVTLLIAGIGAVFL